MVGIMRYKTYKIKEYFLENISQQVACRFIAVYFNHSISERNEGNKDRL